MIGTIRGILKLKKPPALLVDVGGIGYEISASMTTFYHLPNTEEEVFLYTHLIVREDAHILYGFYREEERSLFRTLIKVSNVGPKLALAILSGIEHDAFVRSILDQDIQTLVRVPGVGKKTAERLVIEMRDRLQDYHPHSFNESSDLVQMGENSITQDAIGALIALGFKPQEASRAIAGVKDEYQTREELIRHALQRTLRGDKHDQNGSHR